MGELALLPNEEELSCMTRLATAFNKSGLFEDTQGESQAIVKILAGRELGLTPFQAMRDLDIIKGKITMNGACISARIKQHPDYDYKIVRLTDKGCELRFSYKGEDLDPPSIFSQQDAKDAGLLDKNGGMYSKYPRNMYFNRALTNGARWHCPDVFGGAVYTRDELADEDALEVDGTVIENVSVDDVVPTKNTQDYPKDEGMSRAEMADKYWRDYKMELGSHVDVNILDEKLTLPYLEKHFDKYIKEYSVEAKIAIPNRMKELRKEYAKTKEAEEVEASVKAEGGGKRGRPKGSKNKKGTKKGKEKVAEENASTDNVVDAALEVFPDSTVTTKTLEELGRVTLPAGKYKLAGKELRQVEPKLLENFLTQNARVLGSKAPELLVDIPAYLELRQEAEEQGAVNINDDDIPEFGDEDE